MKQAAARFKWDIKNAGADSATIYIYGDIVSSKWDDSDVTADEFRRDLEAIGPVKILNIYVNSLGGSVFQAIAIHSVLSRHPAVKNGYVDAVAASAASVLLTACDNVYMPANTMQMLHAPLNILIGMFNAKDMREMADGLDRIEAGTLIPSYLAKAGDKLTEDSLRELLSTDSWLTAQDAYDIGLCDEVLDEVEIAACADAELIAMYPNVPESLKTSLAMGVKKAESAEDQPETLSAEEREQIIAGAKASIDKKNRVLATI